MHNLSTLDTIGNTPFVQLKKILHPGSARVYVKLEQFNPTSSYKDRMALAMIEEAEKRGDLQPGMKVIEYTGGSTGSSLAFVCAVKGYKFKVVSSDAFAEEKINTMKAFGANVHIVPSHGGKTTPDLVPRMIEKAKEFTKSGGTYFTDQLNNHDTIKGYENLGKELIHQIPAPIDVFCGAVGTAGMLMGVSNILKVHYPNTKIIALETASSAVISTGQAGTHHVEGIGIGFIPPLFDENKVDDVRAIEESSAREMACRLAREEGIFAGTSSGLNIYAAVEIASEIGKGKTVVTVAVDSGLKYLAGDLYNAKAN
jgi:cysteine synthase A